MLCSGRILAATTLFNSKIASSSPLSSSSSLSFSFLNSTRHLQRRFNYSVRCNLRWRILVAANNADASSFAVDSESSASDKNSAAFCIIEGPKTVQDFVKMELQEIQDNFRSRRNKIFCHMEEVWRLRRQQRIKSVELGIIKEEQENELPDFPSFIPFLPPLRHQQI